MVVVLDLGSWKKNNVEERIKFAVLWALKVTDYCESLFEERGKGKKGRFNSRIKPWRNESRRQ